MMIVAKNSTAEIGELFVWGGVSKCPLYDQYEILLHVMNREDPKGYRNSLKD